MAGFVQSTVARGEGSCVCVGNAYRNIVWTNHLLDNAMCLALDDERCSKVLVMSSERREREIEAVISYASTRGMLANPNWRDKLALCSSLEVNFGSKVDEILFSSTAGEYVAVFIFSLSDLLLQWGAAEALRLIASHIRHCKEAQRLTKRSVLLMTSLHQSLHQEQLLMRVSALFSTVAKVVPNYGTLSSSICAEVQVVRRLEATGKVTEQIEMFVWRNHFLQPLKTSTEQKRDSVNNANKHAEEDEHANKIHSLGIESIKIHEIQRKQARLITFESTDPEFDEDSDPDADLDL